MDRNVFKTALYRFFDAEGVLLYVGITNDPPTRWSTHKATKPWWSEVVVKEVEWFSYRTDAERAEVRALRNENPRYNIRDMPREMLERDQSDREWDSTEFVRILKRVTDEGEIKASQLAGLAGISRPQIYRWLNGEGRPKYGNLVRLGTALARMKPDLGIGRRELLDAGGYDVDGVPPTESVEADLSVLTKGELLDQIEAVVAELRSRAED